MDPRNILNSEQMGRSPYNKMNEENVSQNNLNTNGSTAKVNILDAPQQTGRKCSWPHQWTLNECCCGCTLRTGCLLLGWFFMLGSSLLIVGSMSIPLPMLYRWEDFVFTCLKFISSVILLVGVYKHKLKLIRISVFLSLIDIIVEIILAIIMASQLGHVYPILVLFVGVPLAFYFLVIINSYANQMASGVYSTTPRMCV